VKNRHKCAEEAKAEPWLLLHYLFFYDSNKARLALIALDKVVRVGRSNIVVVRPDTAASAAIFIAFF